MSVSQMVKPGSAVTPMNRHNSMNLTSVFSKNGPVSYLQSLLFIKKLLAISISNITYMRAVFPEVAYSERFIDDYRVKVLCENNRCPGACTMINWIRSCFDAMDKKYLKQLTMIAFTDGNDEDTVIESYSFTFCYNDLTTMELCRNKERILTAQASSETKKATLSLLRTLVVLMQTLNPLPKHVFFSMKLLYYDDVTPADYEPKGFVPCSSNAFKFSIAPVNIRVGNVNTPFHSLKLQIKTDATQFKKPTEEGNIDDEHDMSVDPLTSTALSEHSSAGTESATETPLPSETQLPCETPLLSETPLPPETPLPSDENTKSISTLLDVVSLIANVDIKEEKPFISQEQEVIVIDLASSPEGSPKRPSEQRDQIPVADLAKKNKLSLTRRELADFSSKEDDATMANKENRFTKRTSALKDEFEFDEEDDSSQQSQEVTLNRAASADHRCSKRRKCSNPLKPWLAKY